MMEPQDWLKYGKPLEKPIHVKVWTGPSTVGLQQQLADFVEREDIMLLGVLCERADGVTTITVRFEYETD